MAKQNYGGVYANMEFPPYEYREYPKHIMTGVEDKYEVVYTKDEEEKVMRRLQRAFDALPTENAAFIVKDPEKDLLIARAHELGVPINRKWSKAKLQSVLADAENEIDSLPPEGAAEEALARPITLVEKVDEPTEVKAEEAPKSAPAPAKSDNDLIKAALIAEAKSLGLNPPGLMLFGIPRLRAMIAEHKAKNE